MIPTKATVIVFSATGTSRKSAMAIAKGLGCPVDVIDVMKPVYNFKASC